MTLWDGEIWTRGPDYVIPDKKPEPLAITHVARIHAISPRKPTLRVCNLKDFLLMK